MGLVQPVLAFLFQLLDCLESSLGTYSVCSMRVGKVACHENLVRTKFLDQRLDDIQIRLCTRKFLHSAGLIERKIEEVDIGIVVKTE